MVFFQKQVGLANSCELRIEIHNVTRFFPETTCVNVEDNAICDSLAETGQCANNLTVVQNCRWSCGNCRELFEVRFKTRSY